MNAARTRFETSLRPWLRLHLSTWLLLLMPAAWLMLANIPGEHRHDWHNREVIGCEHGWPCTWLVRQPITCCICSAASGAQPLRTNFKLTFKSDRVDLSVLDA